MSALLYKRRPGFIPSPYIAELLDDEDITSLADLCVMLQQALEVMVDQTGPILGLPETTPQAVKDLIIQCKERHK